MSQNNRQIFRELIERTELSRKVFYHFTIIAIIKFNKILITKNRRILVFNNFFTQALLTLQKNNKTKIVYFLLIEF